MLVKPEQKEKAEFPIFVTLHSTPSISTEEGIVIEISVVGFVSHITSHSAGSTFIMVYLNEYPS